MTANQRIWKEQGIMLNKIKKKSKVSWASIIAVACLWFGGEMGSGTASGANSMNYFVKVGWIGLWFCVIATVMQSWYGYWGNEFSRLTNKHTYSDFLHQVWKPLDKYMVPAFDIFVVATSPIFISGCISGIATMLNQYFGMNYAVSVLVVTIAYLIIALAGVELLEKIGTALTVVIVVAIVVVLGMCIPRFWTGIVEVQRNRMMGEGYTMSRAVWLMIAAWGQQCSCINTSVATNQNLKTKDAVIKAVSIHIGLMAVVKIGLTVMLQGRWPGNLNAPIYILEATEAVGSAVIGILYPILLAACFVSTGPLNIYSNSTRWVNLKAWDKLKDENFFKKHRMLVCSVAFTVLSYLLANFDFNFITGVIQVYASYLWLLLYAIPISIICPVKVRKLKKVLKNAGIDPDDEIPELISLKLAGQDIP